MDIRGFKFTHRKAIPWQGGALKREQANKAYQPLVGVLENTKTEVVYAYDSGGQLYHLSPRDFNRRFRPI